MHLVVGDHMIVEQDENMGFSITEEKNKYESFAVTSILQTSEELGVTRDLLKQSIDVASVHPHVKDKHSTQLQAMNATDKTVGASHQQAKKLDSKHSG